MILLPIIIKMKQMNPVIISHAADLDGIASAALILRRYGAGAGNAIFVDYDKASMLRGEKRFRKLFKKGSTLFITDLGSESTPDILSRIVSHAKRKNGRVLWFDHHTWSRVHVKGIAGMCDVAVVGENERFCASEITARELGMNDAFVKRLLQTVHVSDFALRPRTPYMKSVIKAYALGLSYSRMKGSAEFLKSVSRAAASIRDGKVLPGFLRSASARFEKLNDSRLRKMMGTVVNGGAISIAFTPVVSTNDACAMIMRKTGSDIGCYVNTDVGKAHLRSKKNDCSVLARRFGGGGHFNASGFDFDMKKYDVSTARGRIKFADKIIKAASELY